ncbi:MAG TPA: HIT family protein [Saprospiraceae bacterium]|nr:HIT family protein [Saprospiraceae bacterium]
MATLFTKIINGEIPCYKVAETEHCFAFLDIKPLAKGHTLVIPKFEVDYYFELPNDHFIELNLFSKQLATAIKKVVPCIKVGVSVIGLEVPHAHLHLVPLNQIGDLNFSLPRKEFSIEEYTETAAAIRSAL